MRTVARVLRGDPPEQTGATYLGPLAPPDERAHIFGTADPGADKTSIVAFRHVTVWLRNGLRSARTGRVGLFLMYYLIDGRVDRLGRVWVFAQGKRRTWITMVCNAIVFFLLMGIVHHGGLRVVGEGPILVGKRHRVGGVVERTGGGEERKRC